MERESLLEVAPLLKGKLADQRIEIKENIVKYALSLNQCPDNFDITSLINLCNRKFGIELDPATVNSTLADLQEEGYVNYVKGEKYELLESPQTTTFNELTDPVWEEFLKILQNQSDEIDIFYLNKNMEPAFKNFLLEFFLDIAESFEALSEYQIDTLYSEDTENLIDETIEDYNFQNEAIFRETLVSYLENPRGQEQLLDFTDKVYRGIVNVDLLSRDQDVDFPSLKNESKVLILDTNVLVNLLCTTDKQHAIASSVCERSKEIGFDLHYTSETRDELDAFISGSEDEMSGIYHGDKTFDAASSQFVKDFRKRDQYSWEGYVEEIKNWQEELGKFGVTELDGEIEPNKKVQQEAKESLIQYENSLSPQSFNRLEHDSILFGYVARKRIDTPDDFGPFILSFHNGFTDASKKLNQKGGLQGILGSHETALQPRSWLNYILAFTPAEIEEGGRRQISLAILQGATNFDDTLTIQEYARLLVPKAGLKGEDEEYLADFLRGHRLQQELEEALDNDEGHRAEEISREILTDEEYIETIREKRDFHKRVQKASSRVENLEKEVEKRDDRVKKLERELKRLKAEKVVPGDTHVHVEGSQAISKSNAEATATATVEFDQQFLELKREFESQLPCSIEDSKFPEIPDEDSSVSEKKEWLQTASAVVTMADVVPTGIEQLQPALESLLATAIQLA